MKKDKIDFRLEVKNDIINDTATVYLYGDIVDERPVHWWSGEEVEGDFILPADVRSLFENIKENNINLHINSYGGSVFASVAIFNYLNGLNKNITTYNDGICASGASLIFMAGNKTVMPTNTMLMIHRASSYGWGNCNDLREMADTLEKLDNTTVLETYKTKFKGTDEELMNLIGSETWIGAREAKEFGFCDELLELNKGEDAKKEHKEKPEESKENIKEEEITNGINFMKNFVNLKIKEIK